MIRRSGLTMIEMMIAVSLLAVVGLVSVQVFRATMNVHRDTTAAHDALGRTQRLGEILRSEIWRAVAIEVVDGKLRLIDRDGGVVVWGVEAETTLVRAQGELTDRWRLEMPVGFEREGPSVVVRFGDQGARMRFVSQVMLAGEVQ